MYAKVVVNQPSSAVDRLFDYLIPDNLSGIIAPGMRVIVPFSRNNSEKEAYVMYITESTDTKCTLKSIISIAADEPAFKEDMVEIIEYMHERYLSPYIDIIHTLIPAGTSIKTVEWVLLNADVEYFGKNETDNKIIRLLQENGGGMDIYSLSSYFTESIKSRLTQLKKKDIIHSEFLHSRNVDKRTIRAVRLCVDDDAALEYCNSIRSRIQKNMIAILLSNEFISTADIVRFTSGNYNALSMIVKNGIAEFFDLTVERPVYDKNIPLVGHLFATEEQKTAIDEITSSIDKNKAHSFLLHGVTGSGKTEVFLQTIDYTVKQGKSALVLVPEISLTPQMVSRFVNRFGERIAVLHSGLSPGERYDQWYRVLCGKANIVIGARSAVFAPLSNIGIIIVDEEHSETYKSEMTPRYNAKEIALKRSEQFGAVTVFASATPSVESYTKALTGEYKLIEMKKRYNEGSMPDIHIVDMRDELENGNKSMFSKSLHDEIKHNIENKEQTILLMNRRGFSTFVSCRKCGFVPICQNCNISLTYHKYDDSLKCHYCGHIEPNYSICPACGSKYIRYFGGGTQRVEEEVKKLFPDATTIRLDADVTTRKNSHKKILDSFVKDKIDILIGTQMVSKGLDFSNVTLVGVMSADTTLHMNDFRSGERTFDLLEQVSGRAGRGDKKGRAVIQTYTPEDYAINLVKTHNYKEFYNKTIKERCAMWYPPYCEMVCIRISDESNDVARKASFKFKEAFGDINEMPERIAILGPIPSHVSKIKNKYRWQIIIKSDNIDSLNGRLQGASKAVREEFDLTQVIIDKNPISIY